MPIRIHVPAADLGKVADDLDTLAKTIESDDIPNLAARVRQIMHGVAPMTIVASVQGQLQAMVIQLEAHKKIAARLEKDNALLETKNKELFVSIGTLNHRVGDLEDALRAAQLETAHVRSTSAGRVAALESEVEQLRIHHSGRLVALEAEVSRISTANSELTSNIRALHEQLIEQAAALQRREEERQRREEEHLRLEAMRQAEEADRAARFQEELRQNKEQMEAMMKTLYATAPP